MRAIKAAVLYFAIAFGPGLALGPVRVLLVEPRFGATAAVVCEAPILLVAMAMAA